MRTKGSCRFEAYYKIEHYDNRFCVWRVIQKSFSSAAAAEAFAIGTGYEKTRVIKITEKGIKIL
jgi:hypothetical protein